MLFYYILTDTHVLNIFHRLKRTQVTESYREHTETLRDKDWRKRRDLEGILVDPRLVQISLTAAGWRGPRLHMHTHTHMFMHTYTQVVFS